MKIKFRIWDKLYNLYTIDIMYPNNQHIMETFFINYFGNVVGELYDGNNVISNEHYEDSDRFVVEQYTGLKDKNGKEIYDGDICAIYDENVPDEATRLKEREADNGCSDLYIVEWYEDEAKWIVNVNSKHGDEGYQTLSKEYINGVLAHNYASKITVIGNIHKNKDLLG